MLQALSWKVTRTLVNKSNEDNAVHYYLNMSFNECTLQIFFELYEIFT